MTKQSPGSPYLLLFTSSLVPIDKKQAVYAMGLVIWHQGWWVGLPNQGSAVSAALVASWKCHRLHCKGNPNGWSVDHGNRWIFWGMRNVNVFTKSPSFIIIFMLVYMSWRMVVHLSWRMVVHMLSPVLGLYESCWKQLLLDNHTDSHSQGTSTAALAVHKRSIPDRKRSPKEATICFGLRSDQQISIIFASSQKIQAVRFTMCGSHPSIASSKLSAKCGP